MRRFLASLGGFGVVEVEVGAARLGGGGLRLLVVPEEEAGLVVGGGEGFEASPLEGEGSGGWTDELTEVFPVQKLGLLDVEGSGQEAGWLEAPQVSFLR